MKLFLQFVSIIAIITFTTVPTLSQEYVPDIYTVALYHFNETSDSIVHDATINGNNGTATGTTIVNGKYGNARSFNSGAFVEIPNSSSLNLSTNITVEAWIKVSAMPTDYAAIVVKRETSPFVENYGLYIAPVTGKLQFQFTVAQTRTADVYSDTGVVDSQWHHVAGTFDGNEMKVYIDGRLSGSLSESGPPDQDTTQVLIGKKGDPIYPYQFTGIIDEVRISNKAREPWEFNVPGNLLSGLVAYYPFNGNAGDSSGNGNNGTINGGATPTTDRFGNNAHAYFFNGVNQDITVPPSISLDFSQSFTVSVWAMKIGVDPSHGSLVATGGSSCTKGFLLQDRDNGVRAEYSDGITNCSVFYNQSLNTDDGNWHHFIYCVDKITQLANLYVDGVNVYKDFNLSGNGNIQVDNIPLKIGSLNSNPADPQYFSGAIDDIRIYNRVLNGAEITQLYGNYRQVITSIKDIPSDQGGKVRISWNKIYLDTVGANPQITSYGVWRKIPPGNYAPMKKVAPFRVVNDTLGTMYDFLGSVSAVQSPSYNFVASTLYDSSDLGVNSETFLVTAHTADPNVYYISDPDTGYSVDNLAPLPPRNLEGTISSGMTTLHWNPNSEPDLRQYVIYQKTSLGQPDSLVGTTQDTEFVYANATSGLYYDVHAQDIHGNLSKPSEVQVPTGVNNGNKYQPISFALNQNYPNPFNPTTSISFSLLKESRVTIKVYNILGDGVTSLVGGSKFQPGVFQISWNGTNFTGTQVSSGMYFYRIIATPSDGSNPFIETKKMLLLK